MTWPRSKSHLWLIYHHNSARSVWHGPVASHIHDQFITTIQQGPFDMVLWQVTFMISLSPQFSKALLTWSCGNSHSWLVYHHNSARPFWHGPVASHIHDQFITKIQQGPFDMVLWQVTFMISLSPQFSKALLTWSCGKSHSWLVYHHNSARPFWRGPMASHFQD